MAFWLREGNSALTLGINQDFSVLETNFKKYLYRYYVLLLENALWPNFS